MQLVPLQRWHTTIPHCGHQVRRGCRSDVDGDDGGGTASSKGDDSGDEASGGGDGGDGGGGGGDDAGDEGGGEGEVVMAPTSCVDIAKLASGDGILGANDTWRLGPVGGVTGVGDDGLGDTGLG